MKSIKRRINAIRAARRTRLPWRKLEAEAARQGCSAADIFYDWAGCRAAGPDMKATPVLGGPPPRTGPTTRGH